MCLEQPGGETRPVMRSAERKGGEKSRRRGGVLERGENKI